VLSDKLSGADLHSLLLDTFKKRVKTVQPGSLLTPGPVAAACNIDGRLLGAVEQIQQEHATEYEVVELSPLNPLGTLAALTGLDQGNVLSTIR
ncbi:hypothetical protein ABI011_14760, partial [Enterococcus faecium]|uniref:hypothetical protein n=1 Tax=Enterococcus faecium TaxID=1352 RepID=UPI003F43EDAA